MIALSSCNRQHELVDQFKNESGQVVIKHFNGFSSGSSQDQSIKNGETGILRIQYVDNIAGYDSCPLKTDLLETFDIIIGDSSYLLSDVSDRITWVKTEEDLHKTGNKKKVTCTCTFK